MVIPTNHTEEGTTITREKSTTKTNNSDTGVNTNDFKNNIQFLLFKQNSPFLLGFLRKDCGVIKQKYPRLFSK